MRGILLAALSSATLLAAAPAMAVESATDGASADRGSRKICKRTQRTGTRFYSQICKTAAQWEAMAEQQRRDAKELVDRPQIEIRH